MIKLGEIQELEVTKKVDFGVYMKSFDDQKGQEEILLPLKQVPENTKPGDRIKVFVYKDSNDRMIATVRRPKILIGAAVSGDLRLLRTQESYYYVQSGVLTVVHRLWRQPSDGCAG